jgi:hypothetical protein
MEFQHEFTKFQIEADDDDEEVRKYNFKKVSSQLNNSLCKNRNFKYNLSYIYWIQIIFILYNATF